MVFSTKINAKRKMVHYTLHYFISGLRILWAPDEHPEIKDYRKFQQLSKSFCSKEFHRVSSFVTDSLWLLPTWFLLSVPFNFLKFFFSDHIISLGDGISSMSWDHHDCKMIFPSKSKVVNCTMSWVMKSEIF